MYRAISVLITNGLIPRLVWQLNQEDEAHDVSFNLHHWTDDGISFPPLPAGLELINGATRIFCEGCQA